MDSGIPNPLEFKSWCSHYSWIYFRIYGDALSVGEDVPIDDEAPRWLRKSQDDMPTQSLGGAHRSRVCVCAFIEVSVCACI